MMEAAPLALALPIFVVNIGMGESVTQFVEQEWQKVSSHVERQASFRQAIDRVQEPCFLVFDAFPTGMGSQWLERFQEQKDRFDQEKVGMVALGGIQRYWGGLSWKNSHRKEAARRLASQDITIDRARIGKPYDTAVTYVNPDSPKWEAFKSSCHEGSEISDLELWTEHTFGIPFYRPYCQGLPKCSKDGSVILPRDEEIIALTCLQLDQENPRIPVFKSWLNPLYLRSWRQARSALDEAHFSPEDLKPLSAFTHLREPRQAHIIAAVVL